MKKLSKDTRILLRYLLTKDRKGILAMIEKPGSFTKDQFIDACCKYFKEHYPRVITLSGSEKYWIKKYYLQPKKIRSVERIVQLDGTHKLVFNKDCFEFV